MPDTKLILVTGATGYVGGRLVPRLLARRLTDTLEIAQKMGGTVLILKSNDVVIALTSFARDYGITQAVMGKSRPHTGWKMFSPSLVDRLSANLSGVDIILS